MPTRQPPDELADLPAIFRPPDAAKVDAPPRLLITSATPVILIIDDDDIEIHDPDEDDQTRMADRRKASHSAPAPAAEPPAAAGDVVCPFCAHVRHDTVGSCPKCTMEDTPSTRRSTGERIGPWFVLQRKNPTAPGLRFSVLLTLARRGHVTPKSIVRGPTTGQLWRYAGQVKGLSRLFGVCWHCTASVSPDAASCPRCKSAQEIPDDPDLFLESHSTLPLMREPLMREIPAPAEIERAMPRLEGPRNPPERNGTADRNRGPAAAAMLPMSRDAGSETPNAGDGPANELATTGRPRTRANTVTTGLPAVRGENGEPIMSASELAAVFQLDAPPPPGIVRRTSRGAWRVVKVAAILVVFVGAAGTAAWYARPDWRQPARAAVQPYIDQARTYAGAAWDSVRPAGNTGNASDTAPIAAGTLPPITPIQLESDPKAGDRTAANGTKAGDRTAANAEVKPSAVVTPPRSRESARDQSTDTGSTGRTAAVNVRPDAENPLTNVSTWTPPASQPSMTSIVDVRPELDGLTGQASLSTPTSRPTRVAPPPLAGANAASGNPAGANTPANDEQPAQPQPVRETPAPAPAVAAAPREQPKPPIVSGPPKELTLEEATAQATELRNNALDAEARRDWKAALMLYEQIARLPEAAQPSDLKVRLGVAKERAGS